MNDATTTATTQALAERLLEAAASAFELSAIHLGDQLGYYRLLAEAGPLAPAELARRSGTQERYAREWLEQQAAGGLLTVEDPRAPATTRRYALPRAHAPVLADAESLDFMAPLAQLVLGALGPLPLVARAFRGGGGVPFAEYGRTMREGQGRMNRVMLLRQLGGEWLPSVPTLDARLRAGAARAADFGCGQGWASIGLAKTYPHLRVDGFDLDAPSIDEARAHAEAMGVADRVTFAVRDVADPSLAGTYDLVFACEVLHDLGDPVAGLRTARRLLRPGGEALIVDERALDRFQPGCGVWERVLYGFSVHHCLPAGLADGDAGTGTVMRPEAVQAHARAAGFERVEVVPVDHPFFHIYRLVPPA